MLDFQQEGVINEQCHTNSSTVQYGNCEHYWVAVAHILPTRVLCRPACPWSKPDWQCRLTRRWNCTQSSCPTTNLYHLFNLTLVNAALSLAHRALYFISCQVRGINFMLGNVWADQRTNKSQINDLHWLFWTSISSYSGAHYLLAVIWCLLGDFQKPFKFYRKTHQRIF